MVIFGYCFWVYVGRSEGDTSTYTNLRIMRDNTEPEARQAGREGSGSFHIATTERNLVLREAEECLATRTIKKALVELPEQKRGRANQNQVAQERSTCELAILLNHCITHSHLDRTVYPVSTHPAHAATAAFLRKY